MTDFLTFAAMSSSSNAPGSGGSMTMIIMIVAMFALMYFTTIRPQKKQQKVEQQMRENTQIGDEITTIGGVCGKVVAVKDDTVVIETGSDRVKIKFKKYAIQTNNTANEKYQAEREAARAEMEAKRAEKKNKKSKKDEEWFSHTKKKSLIFFIECEGFFYA